MVHSEGCSICGEELVYDQQHSLKQCAYCGAEAMSNVECPQGHFVCDACHRAPANAFIQMHCNSTAETDPMKLALAIMRDPRVKMHGPEHHYLVPAVLIAAYYNLLGDAGSKKEKLAIARKRAEIVPGGHCGTHGACGGALGVGIYVSVISGTTPLSQKEWSLSNRITGECLTAIAHYGGPRCCKRDSFIVIRRAAEVTRFEFGVYMPLTRVVCEFHERNRQCLVQDCIYYPTNSPAAS